MKNGTEVSPVIMMGETGNFKLLTLSLIHRQIEKFIKLSYSMEKIFL